MNELVAYLIGQLHSYSILPSDRKRAIGTNGWQAIKAIRSAE